nr:MAG TPA: hypothetical protein [Ackermannviridae sp.]
MSAAIFLARSTLRIEKDLSFCANSQMFTRLKIDY